MDEERLCSVCGLVRTPSRFGVCTTTKRCKAAYARALRAERAEAGDRPVCSLCGGPLVAHSVSGICTRNPACKRASKAAEVRRRDQRLHGAERELARRQAEERDALIMTLRGMNWTQAEIASKVGLSGSRVGEIIRGE